MGQAASTLRQPESLEAPQAMLARATKAAKGLRKWHKDYKKLYPDSDTSVLSETLWGIPAEVSFGEVPLDESKTYKVVLKAIGETQLLNGETALDIDVDLMKQGGKRPLSSIGYSIVLGEDGTACHVVKLLGINGSEPPVPQTDDKAYIETIQNFEQCTELLSRLLREENGNAGDGEVAGDV